MIIPMTDMYSTSGYRAALEFSPTDRVISLWFTHITLRDLGILSPARVVIDLDAHTASVLTPSTTGGSLRVYPCSPKDEDDMGAIVDLAVEILRGDRDRYRSRGARL
jgi:hypothetical protein